MRSIYSRLDRAEGAVREPTTNRSVVTIRLLMRALYYGITANNDDVQGPFQESKNALRTYYLLTPYID